MSRKKSSKVDRLRAMREAQAEGRDPVAAVSPKPDLPATPDGVPDQIYGELREALHIVGYSFERSWQKLERLLESDMWMRVAPGYSDVNAFMGSIEGLLPKGASPDQRKAVAKRIKELQPDTSQRKIAGVLGVDEKTVRNDLSAEKSAPAPEQSAKVRDDEIDTAEKSAPAPMEPTGAEAAKIVDRKAKRELRERDREAKREKNRELVTAVAPPDPTDQFQTIVLDPPWDWGDEGDVDQMGRARPTYDTMSIDQVLALPVRELAAENAHIYLWITNRSLPKGFDLLNAWGFRYITALTWVKPHFGMGNYFRGQTEHVLFGVRGSLPLLVRDQGTSFASPRPGEHSAKPSSFYEIVERCSPGPWLEMFLRGEPRPGWQGWGAEAIA